MSINAGFRQIAPELLDDLRKRPFLAQQIVFGDADGLRIVTSEEKELVREMAEETRRSVTSSLDELIQVLPKEQKAAVEALSPSERKLFAERLAERFNQKLDGSDWENGETEVEVSEELEGLGPSLEIDKRWHGVHFVLCGDVKPGPTLLSKVVLGGTEVGADMGYGAVRYLIPGEVKAVAGALAEMSQERFAERFSAEDLDAADVYPGGWSEESCLEWLVDAFSGVRDFYQEAAAGGNAMLLYLT